MARHAGDILLTLGCVGPRGPNLPDQGVIDLAHRRVLFLLDRVVGPNEFYFVAGLHDHGGAWVVSVYLCLGRVWGGYACPQNGWTDNSVILVDAGSRATANAASGCITRLGRTQTCACASPNGCFGWGIAVATGGAWGVLLYRCSRAGPGLVTLERARVAIYDHRDPTATTFCWGASCGEQVCILYVVLDAYPSAMMEHRHDHGRLSRLARRAGGKGNLRKRERAAAQRAKRPVAAAGPGPRATGLPHTRPARAAIAPVLPTFRRRGHQGDCARLHGLRSSLPSGHSTFATAADGVYPTCGPVASTPVTK